MHEKQAEKLIDSADSYYEFLKLSAEEQKWLMPMLGKGAITTIQMLKLITEKPLTFEEIAEEIGINPHTVTRKLNALAKGGFPIEMTASSAFAPTGRPRKLAKRV
jgi:response regulator of citrate/malate metabolism